MIFLFTIFLFFIFTPGIIFTVSKKISKIKNAMIHAFLFSIAFYFINTFLDNNIYEGLISNYNGNYPLACNSSTVGQMNENNYTCTKKTVNYVDNYEWVKKCDSTTEGDKNEMGKICTVNVTGDTFVYNWT